MTRTILFASLFAVTLATLPTGSALADNHCTVIFKCKPVPIILPGCPSCTTKPAPSN